MRPPAALLALVIAALAGVAACGDGTSTAGGAGPFPVAAAAAAAPTPASPGPLTIKDFAFAPVTITITAGMPLEVSNADNQPHTATSDQPGVFDTSSIPAAGAAAHPILVTTPGTYAYHCSFHPFMHGTLVVQ